MIVSLLFLLLAATLFWSIKQRYSYWNRRNFPTDPDTHIPFGCLKSVVKHEKPMGEAIYDAYLRSKSPFVGIYLLFRPALLVRDPELARQILVQDFNSFHDRGVYSDEKRNPLSCSLFASRGQSWRTLRQKLTPSFSSGKLKAMFQTSDDVGNKMVAHLNKILPDEEHSVELDMKEIFVTYSIDIIGSVIFGLEINSFTNPENEFISLVHKARHNTLINANIAMLTFLCPTIVQFMARLGFRNYTAVGLREIMKLTIEYREKHNVIRKDMLQLMMQLRNTGKINEDDDNWSAKPNTDSGKQKEFTWDHIGAQGYIFYIAGQETISSTAAFTIFELAQYPELLARAQKEVDEVLARHNDQLSYDALREMPFLELCLQETNRKYPFPFLNRECTKDFTIPGTNHVIEKGTPIIIPLLGIHRDAEYFPNPMAFDPDRFSPSSPNYSHYANAYMPFGIGPRQCIALRMGMISSKLGVVKILQNFNIEIMSRREIIMDNHSVGIQPKGGLKVRLSKKAKSA